eukprot:m.50509 g.50509  ORF g.50509 m.50509 type:complete len:53 (-) comp10888_c0_seq3:1159-1317(-)
MPNPSSSPALKVHVICSCAGKSGKVSNMVSSKGSETYPSKIYYAFISHTLCV